MSSWTHVFGVIEADTFARSEAEAMYIAQTVINHLPKIRGSEHDVEFHLNKPNWTNCSSGTDEFGHWSNLYNDSYFKCFERQTCVLITMSGSLRDTEFKDTLRQTTKMLARLSKRLFVDNCLVSVKGNEDNFVFDNPQWVCEQDRSDWTDKLLWQNDE